MATRKTPHPPRVPRHGRLRPRGVSVLLSKTVARRMPAARWTRRIIAVRKRRTDNTTTSSPSESLTRGRAALAHRHRPWATTIRTYSQRGQKSTPLFGGKGQGIEPQREAHPTRPGAQGTRPRVPPRHPPHQARPASGDLSPANWAQPARTASKRSPPPNAGGLASHAPTAVTRRPRRYGIRQAASRWARRAGGLTWPVRTATIVPFGVCTIREPQAGHSRKFPV